MSLVPFGLSNIHLPSSDTLSVTSNTEHELPPGVNAANKWCYGEVEFEALMRQLDNAVSCHGKVFGPFSFITLQHLVLLLFYQLFYCSLFSNLTDKL